MDQLLLRPEEAAEVLAVGRDRIYELIGSGLLRSVKLGRSRRIRAAELEAFVEELSRAGSPVAESAVSSVHRDRSG